MNDKIKTRPNLHVENSRLNGGKFERKDYCIRC